MDRSLKVGNLDVPYATVEGEVVEVRLLSETHVTGYGGGGTEDAFGNFSMNPIDITSQVRNRAHAVVRWDSGREGSFEADARFTLRAGHRIVAINLARKGATRRAYVYNRDTGQIWIEALMMPTRRKGILLGPLLAGLLVSVVGIVLTIIWFNVWHKPTDTFALAVALGLPVGIIWGALNVALQSRANAQLGRINRAFRDSLRSVTA